jgi:hypothetical protein
MAKLYAAIQLGQVWFFTAVSGFAGKAVAELK